MASLFDLAAELSQFGLSGQPHEDKLAHAFGPRRHVADATAPTMSRHRQSTLSILDETLQTIYDTSTRQRTAALLGLKAVSKSQEQLENRLRELHATTRSAVKLQKVYAHSVSYPTLPQNEPQEADNAQQQHVQQLSRRPSSNNRDDADGCDPDLVAKSVLREISDEMDQVAQVGLATSDELVRRYLTDKYIEARLNKLPATPFVQLAKRKAAQKIQQLVQPQSNELQIASSSKDAVTSACNTTQTTGPSSNSASASDAALWNKLKVLSGQQHAMLQKLLRIPGARVGSLPPAQQEFVQFAKRYDRMLQLSEQEICKLPLQHQHIVRNLQQQAAQE